MVTMMVTYKTKKKETKKGEETLKGFMVTYKTKKKETKKGEET
jgi:hypothetical protein